MAVGFYPGQPSSMALMLMMIRYAIINHEPQSQPCVLPSNEAPVSTEMVSPQNNTPPLLAATYLYGGLGSAEVPALPPIPSLAAPYTTTASHTTGTASSAGAIQAAGVRPAISPPLPTAFMPPLPSPESGELNTPVFERPPFAFPEASGPRDSGHCTFNSDLNFDLSEFGDINALLDEVAASPLPEGHSLQSPEPSGSAPPSNLNQDRGAPPTLDFLLATGNFLPTNAQGLRSALHSPSLLVETQSAGHVTPTCSTGNIQAAPSHNLCSNAANTVQQSVHIHGNSSNILQPHVSNVIQPPLNAFQPGESSQVDHAEFPQCYQQPSTSANPSNYDSSNVNCESIHENANYIPPINVSSQLSHSENAILHEIMNMEPDDLINEFRNLSENFNDDVADISRNDKAAPVQASSDDNSDARILAAASEPSTSFEYGSLQHLVPQTSDSQNNAGRGATVQQGTSDGTCFLEKTPSQIASAGSQLQVMYPSSVTQSQGRQQVVFQSTLMSSQGQQEQVVSHQNEPQQMIYIDNVQQHNAQNLIWTPMPSTPNAATPPRALVCNAQLSTGHFILQNVSVPGGQNSNDFSIVGPRQQTRNQNDLQQTTRYMDGETLHRRMPVSEYSHLQNTPSQLPQQLPGYTPLLNLVTSSGPPVVVSVPEEHHPTRGANRRRSTAVMGQRASDQVQELVVQQQGAGVQQQQQVSRIQLPSTTQRWQPTTQQRVMPQQQMVPMQQSTTMSPQQASANGQQLTQVQPATRTQAGQNMQSRFVQQEPQLHNQFIPKQTVQSSSQQTINLSQQQQTTHRQPNLVLTQQPSQMRPQQHQLPSRLSQQQQPQQEHQQFVQPTMPVRRVPGYGDRNQGGITTTRIVVLRKNPNMGAQPAKTLKINSNVKDSNSPPGSGRKYFFDGKRIYIATPRSQPYPVAADTSTSDQALSLHGSVSAPNLTSQMTSDPSSSSTSLASSSVELRDLLASIDIPSNESQSAYNRVHLLPRIESNGSHAVQGHDNGVTAAVSHPAIEPQPSTSTGFTGARPQVPAGTNNSHWSVGPSRCLSARREPESSEEDELNNDDDVLQLSFNGSSEESGSGSGGKVDCGRGRGVGPMRRSRSRRSGRASAYSGRATRLSPAEQKRIDAEKYRKNVEANNMASKKCREKRKEKERETEEAFEILSVVVPERREDLLRLERYRDILREWLKFTQKKPPKDEK